MRFQIPRWNGRDQTKIGDASKTEITYLADEIRIEDVLKMRMWWLRFHIWDIKRTSATNKAAAHGVEEGPGEADTRDEDYIEHLL